MKSLVAAFVLGSLAIACSSSSGSTDTSTTPPAPASLCSTDPRAQTFTEGMVQKGTAGVYSIKLNSVNPWPIVKGNNAWDIVIVDANGAPVSGSTFTVKPWMPDHGHGSSLQPTISPASNAGEFSIADLNVFMAGIWTFTFTITGPSAGAASPQSDTVVYSFCVDD